MPKTITPPKYARYRGKFARVSIRGRVIHLGLYDSDEAKAKYKRLIAEWAAGQEPESNDVEGTTVAELLEAYRNWAEHFYGDEPRGRYRNLLPTIRAARELFADTLVEQFTPKRLKTLRQAFIDSGNVRSLVNAKTRNVARIFRWGVSEELVPATVALALSMLEPLKLGRSGVREGHRVLPVAPSTVEATLSELTPIVADMVRVQMLLGCRPGELCRMTPGQIDRTGDVWRYTPTRHKTQIHGKTRTVFVGPRCQAILRPYLLRGADTPCFSPIEAYQQNLAMRRERRVTPENEGNRPHGARKAIKELHDRYDSQSYARAIKRAVQRLNRGREDGDKLQAWSPNQLRHLKATEVRKLFGLDGVQAALGHSHARVSEIYAELSDDKGVEIARRLG